MIKNITIIYEPDIEHDDSIIDSEFEEKLKKFLDSIGYKEVAAGYGFGQRDMLFHPKDSRY